jgi:alkylation response protein AidB-like acyl-CoA dehydrogenase
MTVAPAGSARVARAALAGAVAVNLLLLYWPRPVGGEGLPHLDKAVHLLAFAAVAWTGLRARVPAGWLLPLLVLHAVLSELAQARLLPDRSGDWADVLADLLGILAGTLLVRASWRDERAVRTLRRR